MPFDVVETRVSGTFKYGGKTLAVAKDLASCEKRR
jgi:hypothetical protein